MVTGTPRRSTGKSEGEFKKPSGWWAVAGLVVAVALSIWVVDRYLAEPATGGKSFQVKGGETRRVLNPFQFGSRRVALAYLAAQNHPGVMNQIFCYCNCNRPPFNHKSLLSCFTDRHGSS